MFPGSGAVSQKMQDTLRARESAWASGAAERTNLLTDKANRTEGLSQVDQNAVKDPGLLKTDHRIGQLLTPEKMIDTNQEAGENRQLTAVNAERTAAQLSR